MSEDYLKMFTGVVLLIFVIVAGYFFSERNDRKMFLLSSLVFLVINIACLYVLTASLWFLCGAIMNQGAQWLFQWLLAHYRTLRASTGSEEYLSVLCCHQYGPE